MPDLTAIVSAYLTDLAKAANAPAKAAGLAGGCHARSYSRL